jgi:hypothetical protein
LITAISLFVGFDVKTDFYQPNLRGTILYGGLILALPIWPLFRVLHDAGVDMVDTTARAAVLACFVIICIVLDFAIKRQLGKPKAPPDGKPPG